MTIRFRPIYSGLEMPNAAGVGPRSTQGYHRFGSAGNVPTTSRAMSRPTGITRPAAIFADFRAR